MGIKVIITGATGMVGEGVLLECLAHPHIEKVLMVNRKSFDLKHPKLNELLVADFFHLDQVTDKFDGYDACFYCAGISAVGLTEKAYHHITYDTTLHFAETLVNVNPAIVFGHISGHGTDSSEKGKIMWARIKGKTENALMRLPFRHVYNFRPGMMKPTKGQRNIKPVFKFMASIYPLTSFLFPNISSTLKEVGLAMINSVLKGYPKQVLEVKDIKLLAK
ncbi:NAD-dependent epimerase/dehydratase family protein [Mucilaginibacter gossypii]|uniref:NAD dependent epimerase/dehydratase family protein n=1 Tax=Mucilaginibacter gossypii TaxID=551996 RepID=A0A1G8CQ54_9SPHI|nr:NAD-dependent epimerase/dehydratase family protein [Mucilaginibacter gossypii]SDH47588.1 NAD dependent epimerase/dehydratase family protein [Mucilaginibacter gossypii]